MTQQARSNEQMSFLHLLQLMTDASYNLKFLTRMLKNDKLQLRIDKMSDLLVQSSRNMVMFMAIQQKKKKKKFPKNLAVHQNWCNF